MVLQPGGRRLATVGTDPPLRIWSLDITRDVTAISAPGAVHLGTVSIAPEGRRLAAVDSFERVFVWADGPQSEPRAFPGACFAFPRDPETIAVYGHDGHVRIFRIGVGSVVRDLPCQVHPWGPLALVDGERKFVTGRVDAKRRVQGIELWDAINGQRLGTWSGTVCAVRSDGLELAVKSAADRLALVELGSGKERLSFAVPPDAWPMSFSPDGQLLLTHHPPAPSWPPPAGRCRIWDVRGGQLVNELEGDFRAFHPDGSGVFVSFPDGRIRLVGVGSTPNVRTFAGHEHEAKRVLVTPDRKRLIAGSVDGTIRVWDLVTGLPILVLKGQQNVVTELALSPSGHDLVSAGVDSTLWVWPSWQGQPSEPRSTESEQSAPQ
jgi:WD40 repeat protein